MPRSRRQDTVEVSEMKWVTEWLQALIQKHDLTQNDFASKIGVSTTYVNMLLQAKRKPSIPLLRRIADAFNDTVTLRGTLPRAYEGPSIPRHVLHSPTLLGLDSSLEQLFSMLNQQPAASNGIFTLEQVDDRSLEPWGVQKSTYALCETVHAKDFIAGDLVVYGPVESRQWGFIQSIGSELYVISAGYHLQSLLNVTTQEWSQSELRYLDVSQYHLSAYYKSAKVVKVRLLLPATPNLRSPIVTHPDYQSLQKQDRQVVDQVITRFTSYSRGQTQYQPSQQRRR